MTAKLDPEVAEKKARELLDNRIDAVRALVKSRQTLADLQEQVEQARDEDLKSYRAALNGGWSADELRKLGIEEPAKKRARKAPRTTRQKGAMSERSEQTPMGDAGADARP